MYYPVRWLEMPDEGLLRECASKGERDSLRKPQKRHEMGYTIPRVTFTYSRSLLPKQKSQDRVIGCLRFARVVAAAAAAKMVILMPRWLLHDSFNVLNFG